MRAAILRAALTRAFRFLRCNLRSDRFRYSASFPPAYPTHVLRSTNTSSVLHLRFVSRLTCNSNVGQWLVHGRCNT